MSEDEEFRKLPADEKCVHKLWKARILGYEEATTLFRQIDDDKSTEFTKFAPLIKKMVSDSHAACQEKGLEAALAFVENASVASRIVHDVVWSIIQKAIGSPKVKIRDLSFQIILMYIEIEKQENIIEELFKGFEQKNPKIVLGCVTALTMSLRDFGSKVINVKPIIKKLPVLLSDRDKAIRDEGKNLTIEVFKCIGPSLKSQLSSLQPLQLSELETEFAKVEGQNTKRPSRLLRSEIIKQAEKAAIKTFDNQLDGIEMGSGDEDESDVASIEIDTYENAESIDILSKLPKDFYSNAESKKWQERKTALEFLENLLKTPKLESGDYGELVKTLRNMIAKDTNVLVIALAGKCLAGLASGLKKRFSPYSSACIPLLLEKFRDKKQSVVLSLREALDAISATSNLEIMVEDIVNALKNKNPSVKSETTLFLTRYFSKSLPSTLNKKLLKSYITPLVNNLNESDPTVRDASAEAIGTAMKLVTEKTIMPFLSEVDNLKMAKVKEYAESAVLTAKIPKVSAALSKKAPTLTKAASIENSKSGAVIAKPVIKKVVPIASVSFDGDKLSKVYENHIDGDNNTISNTESTNGTKVDLRNLISDNLIEEMSDKNWKMRNEALLKIQSILTQNKQVKSNIGTLAEALALRLVDSNSKISQCAFNCCELLGEALGPACKCYLKVLFPAFLSGLGDSKSWIRTVSRSCINIWSEQCHYKEIFEGEMIFDAIKSGSPALRSELWSWIADKLQNIPTKIVSRDDLLLCVPILYNNVEDRNADVRKNAQEAIYSFMLHLGSEKMVKIAEKLKPGSKSIVMSVLERHRANLPVSSTKSPSGNVNKPRVESQSSSSNLKQSSASSTTKNVTNAKTTKRNMNNANSASSPFSRKKEDSIDNAVLLVCNNLKVSRINDEIKSKVIRWNPLVSRDEMCELLKNQMLQANVNKYLFNYFFHADFKYHLKALDLLIDNVNENPDGLIANLDLILKWLSLRFYDTNPSVILKGLDYIQLILDVLISKEYRFVEYEALYIIPFLLIKIGDPKDAVRNGVRVILRQIINIYPASRLFNLIMEALKSKNSRQRAECLEELEHLIDLTGITVCQPNASTAFKEIAKQISDRDNSVRNAALNCISAAYFIEGDKILKLIGHIPDKEMSLLEERLKRFAVKREKMQLNRTFSVNSLKSTPSDTSIKSPQMEIIDVHERNGHNDDDSNNNNSNGKEDLIDEILNMSLVNRDQNQMVIVTDFDANKKVLNGPFSLDWDFIRQLESEVLQTHRPDVKEIVTDFLNEPVLLNAEAKLALEKYSDKMPPILDFIANTQCENYKDVNIDIEQLLAKIRGTDLVSTIEAMSKLQLMINVINMNEMNDLENKTISTLAFMLKWLANSHLEFTFVVQEAYQLIFDNLAIFYETKGQFLSTEAILDLIFQLINLLAEDKFEKYDKLNRSANIQCANLIEKSNHTNTVCALIKLLHKYVGIYSTDCRLIDLSLKCLWRVVKKLPSWENNIDFEPILYESYIFFRDYPSCTWKKDKNVPIRTIKTIVYTIVKMKSFSIIMYFVSVPNYRETELFSYTLKVLEALKMEEEHRISSSSSMKSDVISIYSSTENDFTYLHGHFQKTPMPSKF